MKKLLVLLLVVGMAAGCITKSTKDPITGQVITTTTIDAESIVALTPVALDLAKQITDLSLQIQSEKDAQKAAQLQAQQAQKQANLAIITSLIDKFNVAKIANSPK